jgi:hypothetical protein
MELQLGRFAGAWKCEEVGRGHRLYRSIKGNGTGFFLTEYNYHRASELRQTRIMIAQNLEA